MSQILPIEVIWLQGVVLENIHVYVHSWVSWQNSSPRPLLRVRLLSWRAMAILWYEITGPVACATPSPHFSELITFVVLVCSLVPSFHPYDKSTPPFRPTSSTKTTLITPANIELLVFRPYITLTVGTLQESSGELCLSNRLLVPLKMAQGWFFWIYSTA